MFIQGVSGSRSWLVLIARLQGEEQIRSQPQQKKPEDLKLLETDNEDNHDSAWYTTARIDTLSIWIMCGLMLDTWLHSHSLLLLNAAYDIMFFFWQEKDVQLTFTNAT